MKKEKLTIVKIGGHVVDDDNKLNQFLQQFSASSGLRILVHGGGKLASDVSRKMGIEPRMVDGRRITDSETLKVAQMVYRGIINTNIVAKLNAMNCLSIGMTGADVNSILSEKRLVKETDYGYVGDVKQVNTAGIKALLSEKVIPVFCALTHDGWGQILNTNADSVTSALGSALAQDYSVDLVFCFEQSGVLKDMGDTGSVIPDIDKKLYGQLKKDKVVSAGMIPKIDNAFEALDKGVCNVFIKKYNALERVAGTRIHL